MAFSRPPHVSEPPPVRTAASAAPVSRSPSSGSVTLRACAKSWQEQDRRASALFQLGRFLESWPDAFSIASQCQDKDGRVDLCELEFSLSCAVSYMATGTIVRRLGSLSDYVKFCVQQDHAPFPVTEFCIWRFLPYIYKSQCFSSKPASFLQAINWSKGVLGLRVDDGAVHSPRVAGLAKGAEQSAPPPERAPALRVAELRALERMACQAEFSCARSSDAARTIRFSHDAPSSPTATVWLEASVKKPKTATGGRSRSLLPLLAPVVYMEHSWCQQWLLAREELGLDPPGPIKEGSLLPTFSQLKDVLDRPMNSQQLTAWLRLALSSGSDDAERLSSHSLKATCLTWAASAGVSLDLRRLLAHHVPDSARSTETYSREVLTPATRALEEVLTAIRDGDFVPDSSRTGHFKAPLRSLDLGNVTPHFRRDPSNAPGVASAPVQVSEAVALEQGKDGRLSGTDDSASDRQSEGELCSDLNLPNCDRARCPIVKSIPRWCASWMHVGSGCLHVSTGSDEPRLLCGRSRNENYVFSEVRDLEERRPHCKTCWSHTSLPEYKVRFLLVLLALFPSRPCQVMASLVDSSAEFWSRSAQLLSEDLAQKLYDHDIRSFWTLAFAVAVFGENASVGAQAAVRCLAFEGLTFSLQDLKARSDGGDASSSRPLPLHEREDRKKKQAQRLSGLLLEGDSEPSNSLVDKAAQIFHDGVVRYLPPSICISRDAEVASVKRDREFLSLENGELAVKRKDAGITTDVGNEFKLQQALLRRGITLDRVGLLDFSVHERVVRAFFNFLTRPVPPGFERPNVWSIVRADKEMWTLAARACSDGCKPDSSGARPLDDLVMSLSVDASVVFHLLPLPARGRRARARIVAVAMPEMAKVRKVPDVPAKGGRTASAPTCPKRCVSLRLQKTKAGVAASATIWTRAATCRPQEIPRSATVACTPA